LFGAGSGTKGDSNQPTVDGIDFHCLRQAGLGLLDAQTARAPCAQAAFVKEVEVHGVDRRCCRSQSTLIETAHDAPIVDDVDRRKPGAVLAAEPFQNRPPLAWRNFSGHRNSSFTTIPLMRALAIAAQLPTARQFPASHTCRSRGRSATTGTLWDADRLHGVHDVRITHRFVRT
jgi:hypothetical protein